MSKRKLRASVIGAAVVVAAAAFTQPSAVAEPDLLQQQIDEVLAKTEGGVQISKNEIAWDGGAAILAFPLTGETQAPPSSPAARRLQAKQAGISLKEAEKAEDRGDRGPSAAVNATDADPEGEAVDESLPNGEVEPTADATVVDTCPTETFGNDWYCFYQYKNLKGRRLSWNAAHRDKVYFSYYDFGNRTSSWSNRGGKSIYVWGRSRAGDDTSCNRHLWKEDDHTRSLSLPSSLDNRADCFYTS
ncbi:hypothetical protein ACOBQB_10200 [Streptomyces sp. G5(2025)]|uniref:hypothetical protein n=1 Tax=Streptomyces sp. G5(2025) TaxID=3406628 RepID=UPI003C1D5D15